MSEQILTGIYGNLRLDKIIMPDGNNPRDAEPQGNLFGLKDSFESIGQLNAIIVSKVDGKYYAVAGRRRIEAARQAGQTHIEAKVYNDLDQRTLLLMVAAENIHRKDFNAIEEARMIQMLEEEKFHVKVIATKLNMSVDTVRRKRNLLKLPDDIQQMITRKDNPLPVHQAQMLCGLSGEQQRMAARQIAPTTGPVAAEKQAKEIIDNIIGGKLDIADPDDRHPSAEIARKAKSGKLKVKSVPAEKSTRSAGSGMTRQQKNNVPKKLKGRKTLGPEIEINITGKINMEFITDGILDFDEPAILLKIGSGKEKFYKEPLAIDIGQPEKSKIVPAIAQYLKESLTAASGKTSGPKPDLQCPRCKETIGTGGGFVLLKNVGEAGAKTAEWQCIRCDKVFNEKATKNSGKK